MELDVRVTLFLPTPLRLQGCAGCTVRGGLAKEREGLLIALVMGGKFWRECIGPLVPNESFQTLWFRVLVVQKLIQSLQSEEVVFCRLSQGQSLGFASFVNCCLSLSALQ